MKRLVYLTAIFGLSSTLFAASPPGDGLHGSPYLTTVPVQVKVGTITELYMDNTQVNLVIPDAGGVKGTGRAVRNVTYLSNTPVKVGLTLTGDIIDGTYFYVVVNPATPASWDYEFTGNHHAEQVIAFLRQGGAYSGTNLPDTLIPAFERPAGAATIPIVYAAQIGPAGQLSAPDTTTNLVVTWTIAPNP